MIVLVRERHFWSSLTIADTSRIAPIFKCRGPLPETALRVNVDWIKSQVSLFRFVTVGRQRVGNAFLFNIYNIVLERPVCSLATSCFLSQIMRQVVRHYSLAVCGIPRIHLERARLCCWDARTAEIIKLRETWRFPPMCAQRVLKYRTKWA